MQIYSLRCNNSWLLLLIYNFIIDTCPWILIYSCFYLGCLSNKIWNSAEWAGDGVSGMQTNWRVWGQYQRQYPSLLLTGCKNGGNVCECVCGGLLKHLIDCFRLECVTYAVSETHAIETKGSRQSFERFWPVFAGSS